MHRDVLRIATHFGVRIANRSATNNHIFDGKTIATYGGWPQRQTFSDHDLLHEIGHFVAASPEQRDLPEYGLGSVVDAGELYCTNVVDWEEGDTQEYMTQFLSVFWGMTYNISPHLSEGTPEGYADTWEHYLHNKIREVCVLGLGNCVSRMWTALIRLHERGLLTKPF